MHGTGSGTWLTALPVPPHMTSVQACALSRNMSSRAKESGRAPVRHSHYPGLTEAQARAGIPASHEPVVLARSSPPRAAR